MCEIYIYEHQFHRLHILGESGERRAESGGDGEYEFAQPKFQFDGMESQGTVDFNGFMNKSFMAFDYFV